jgi:hypothetical protein
LSLWFGRLAASIASLAIGGHRLDICLKPLRKNCQNLASVHSLPALVLGTFGFLTAFFFLANIASYNVHNKSNHALPDVSNSRMSLYGLGGKTHEVASSAATFLAPNIPGKQNAQPLQSFWQLEIVPRFDTTSSRSPMTIIRFLHCAASIIFLMNSPP